MEALIPEVLETVGFPLLVKPLDAESGHGIRRFDDYRSLIDYLKAPGPYKTLPLLLQRFITGHTLGLSLLATDGVIRCHDVQLHSDDGSRLFYHDPEVIEAGRRIVAAFNYGGPGHIDFVRDDESKRLYALEFNCRFWYSVTVSMWRGGNFPALAIDLARGRSIPASPTKPGAYFQPASVVKMLRQPWMFARLDEVNWRGFWQAISDPIPHLLNRLL
jgi:carbamoylphosphate synthase large subunit